MSISKRGLLVTATAAGLYSQQCRARANTKHVKIDARSENRRG